MKICDTFFNIKLYMQNLLIDHKALTVLIMIKHDHGNVSFNYSLIPTILALSSLKLLILTPEARVKDKETGNAPITAICLRV